jgi:hypothetical protein
MRSAILKSCLCYCCSVSSSPDLLRSSTYHATAVARATVCRFIEMPPSPLHRQTFLSLPAVRIGVTLALTCPLSTFIAFWWSVAAVSIYVTPVPEQMI